MSRSDDGVTLEKEPWELPSSLKTVSLGSSSVRETVTSWTSFLPSPSCAGCVVLCSSCRGRCAAQGA